MCLRATHPHSHPDPLAHPPPPPPPLTLRNPSPIRLPTTESPRNCQRYNYTVRVSREDESDRRAGCYAVAKYTPAHVEVSRSLTITDTDRELGFGLCICTAHTTHHPPQEKDRTPCDRGVRELTSAAHDGASKFRFPRRRVLQRSVTPAESALEPVPQPTDHRRGRCGERHPTTQADSMHYLSKAQTEM